MSKYRLDHDFDESSLIAIREQLQNLDLTANVDFDTVSKELKSYFEAYGFSAMSAREKANYFLGSLKCGEKFKVVVHCWFVENSKGSVFVSHGLFDHVGLYLDLVDHLVEMGFSVIAMDFPGHGLSDGDISTISSFNDYGFLISEVLKTLSKDIPQPVFGLGQSTGCAALLNYVLHSRGDLIKRLVLFAPLVQPRRFFWVSLAHRLFSPFIKSVRRSFTLNSHREHFNEFLENHDILQSKRISVTWVGAMRQWVESFDSLEGSDIPVLIFQGDTDAVVEWEKNVPKIEGKFSSCKTHYISGGMHHLANEGDAWRAPIFNEIKSFF